MTPFCPALEEARVLLSHARPYLSPLFFSLTPVPIEGDDLMLAVDARARLYYHEKGLAGKSASQLAFGLYHETLHLLLQHFERGAPYKEVYPSEFLNICMDLEVNDLLVRKETTFAPLTDTLCLPERLGVPEGKTFEEYVELLKDRVTYVPIGSIGTGDFFGSRYRTTPNGNLELEPQEKTERDDGPEGVEGVSPSRITQLAHYIASQGTQAGNLPGYLERWASALLSPVVPWQALLRSWLAQMSATMKGWRFCSFRKPRRRSASSPFLLPSYYDTPLTVAVVIDTSASMGERDLTRALSEAGGILRRCNQNLWLLSCDTQATDPVRVTSVEHFKMMGGGGTDMGVGIDRAAQMRPRPDLIVCLTDGHTPWPDTGPAMPVLVAIIHSQQPGPPWAKTTIQIA